MSGSGAGSDEALLGDVAGIDRIDAIAPPAWLRVHSRRDTAEGTPDHAERRTRKKPMHERYAAQAKRLQQRISRLLEHGEYGKVRELSAVLQTLVQKAAAAEKRSHD